MRLLVDTNVFLDLILKRDEGFEDALKFFVWCREHKNQTYVTSMSLRDIEYVARRELHDKKKANDVLGDIYSLCSKVIGVSADCAIESIHQDYSDFEDELQIQAAKEAMVDAIVTNNIKDFRNGGVPVCTPREIVKSVTFVSL